MDIADVLRIYRTITVKHLKEIEFESGLSRYTISAVESGNKPIKEKHARILAQVYKADYDNIVVIADESEKEDWSYATVLYYCLDSWLNKNGCFMSEADESSFESSLAKVFKALRIVNNMNCQEVAESMDCTTSSMYDIEGGQNLPGLRKLRSFATLYKVRLSDVFRLQEECMQKHWNFQKVIYEALCVWIRENS